MENVQRKAKAAQRELRRLAVKIPDQATFDQILQSTKPELRDGVRDSIIPWITKFQPSRER